MDPIQEDCSLEVSFEKSVFGSKAKAKRLSMVCHPYLDSSLSMPTQSCPELTGGNVKSNLTAYILTLIRVSVVSGSSNLVSVSSCPDPES